MSTLHKKTTLLISSCLLLFFTAHSAHALKCSQFLKVNHFAAFTTPSFKTELMIMHPSKPVISKAHKELFNLKLDQSRFAKNYKNTLKFFSAGQITTSLKEAYTDFSSPKTRVEFKKSSKEALNFINSTQKSLAAVKHEMNHPLGTPPFARTQNKYGIFNQVEGGLYINLKAQDKSKSDDELKKTFLKYLEELQEHLTEKQNYIDGLIKMRKIRNIKN